MAKLPLNLDYFITNHCFIANKTICTYSIPSPGLSGSGITRNRTDLRGTFEGVPRVRPIRTLTEPPRNPLATPSEVKAKNEEKKPIRRSLNLNLKYEY